MAKFAQELINEVQAELLDQINLELGYVKISESYCSDSGVKQYWEGRKVSLEWVKSLLESK